MTALFKQGDKTDKDNYRPISILPTISKVIEKAVHSQLYGYLDSNNLLAVNQFGFTRARSTALALTQFTDEVLSNIGKGLVNGVVFIDLKKAFDTVDHVILLGKLTSPGLSNNNLGCFHSYLSSRYQKTMIGQASSTSRRFLLVFLRDQFLAHYYLPFISTIYPRSFRTLRSPYSLMTLLSTALLSKLATYRPC